MLSIGIEMYSSLLGSKISMKRMCDDELCQVYLTNLPKDNLPKYIVEYEIPSHHKVR